MHPKLRLRVDKGAERHTYAPMPYVRKKLPRRMKVVTRSFRMSVSQMMNVLAAPEEIHIPGAGRTSADAFREDWNKLGRDFRVSTDKVLRRDRRVMKDLSEPTEPRRDTAYRG